MSADLDKLAAAIAARGDYRGWTFAHEGNGPFCYIGGRALGAPAIVWFTPDYNADGWICVQLTTSEGEQLEGRGLDGAEIPFPVRTPDALFAAVKPWLDMFAAPVLTTVEEVEARVRNRGQIDSVIAESIALGLDPADVAIELAISIGEDIETDGTRVPAELVERWVLDRIAKAAA